MASQPSTPLKPSLLYTIYFLTFEPLAALGGTYLALFNPTRYLRGTLPSTIPTPPISPLIYSLLVNIGSLYFLFAVAEGVVLRLTRKRSVWFAVLGAFCVTDVCHLYAVYILDPERFFAVGKWNGDEWINYGTLNAGLALRIAFMLGFGRN